MPLRRLARWSLVALALIPLWLLRDRARPPDHQPTHQAESVEVDGLRWRVLRAGQGDTTLVLVHGFGEHLLGWRWVLDPLARHYRVLAVDLPGFGASAKPDTTYTLAVMAGWLQGLLDQETSGPLVLVGHSMGGAIVVEAVLQRPGRVAAVVLLAPAGLNAGLGRIGEMFGETGHQAVGWWETARAFITPLHDRAWMAEPPDLAAYDPTEDSSYRVATARVLRDFDFAGIGDRFAGLSVPTLVIWGRFDTVIPWRTADSLGRLLPCGRVVSLNALHRPQMERPDTTVFLIRDFLTSTPCDRNPSI